MKEKTSANKASQQTQSADATRNSVSTSKTVKTMKNEALPNPGNAATTDGNAKDVSYDDTKNTANPAIIDNSVNTDNRMNTTNCADSGKIVPSTDSDSSKNTAPSVGTANTGTLFADEALPEEKPKPQRPQKPQVGTKQQQKLDFAEYTETFLKPTPLKDRHSLNVGDTTYRRLAKAARVLGDVGVTAGSYADAIINAHLDAYKNEHAAWSKLINF